MTSSPTNEARILCEVPFCSKSQEMVEPSKAEWICPDHWRLVPIALRQKLAAAKKRGRVEAGDYLWRECRRSAIEAATGLQ